MKRRLALLFAVAATAVGAASTAPALPSVAPVTAAKPCGAGYVHAVLSWGYKCLRVGQFCKVSADREYHRYRFHCHTGRLTR
jgi:hypothetical protein